MSQEYLSIAIWEPQPGMEAASLATIRELNAIVSNKGYGRDLLYRGGGSQYVLLRYWNSEQARAAAQEDPDVLRCWARLGNEIQILKVYEKLEEVGV
jgi:heme-degrading monooxygenase HmoA